MNREPMTKADRLAAMQALTGWLHSQGISPLDAAYIMAVMAGGIVAGVHSEDRERCEDGVSILAFAMYQAANIADDNDAPDQRLSSS